jgi:hypothetical protein
MHSKSGNKYALGGILMTVISEVQQTLAGLKSAEASFETFALQTDNEQAKQMYQQASQQTQAIVDTLSPRVQQILEEELQYKE